MNNRTSSLESSHFPVMLNEVIKISSPSKGGKYIDCTFGGGGYSKKLLKFPKTIVKGLDRDKTVSNIANKLEKKFPKNKDIKIKAGVKKFVDWYLEYHKHN